MSNVDSNTSQTEQDAKFWLANPIRLLACGFGTGLVPKAPGTAGTLVGIPFAIMFLFLESKFGGFTYWILTTLSFFLGVLICQKTTEAVGIEDDPRIVWDEVVGFLLPLYFIPTHFIWLLVAFGLFRYFDIIKPWPIGWVDKRVNNAWGIMLDDVIAGIYAAVGVIVLQLLTSWFLRDLVLSLMEH